MTCVSLLSLCDGILDCRFVDDEHFCHPAIPVCPMNCSCLLFVLTCVGLTEEERQRQLEEEKERKRREKQEAIERAKRERELAILRAEEHSELRVKLAQIFNELTKYQQDLKEAQEVVLTLD